MFKDLDPLLHSQLRLAVISLLLSVEEADFVFIREKTGSTAGNLSVQIEKLSEAGYINVRKFIDGLAGHHRLGNRLRFLAGFLTDFDTGFHDVFHPLGEDGRGFDDGIHLRLACGGGVLAKVLLGRT